MKLYMIIGALCFSFVCRSQTYYNPRETIDINLTIQEPYKPINYNQIGQDFNNTLQAELARREALKKYYADIYYQTKASMYENSILTNDYQIDNLILKLRSTADQHVQGLYNLLTSGQLNPNSFESKIRASYYEYINSNRGLAYLSKYKFQKTNLISSSVDLSEFNLLFDKAINSVSSFNFSYSSSKLNFEVTEFMYEGNKSVDGILSYVTMICDKQIDIDELKLRLENKLKEDSIKKRQEMKEISESIFGFYATRMNTLNSLTEKEKIKYLKGELKYIKSSTNKYYKNYILPKYVSKYATKVPEYVVYNIVSEKMLINFEEEDDSKIIYNEEFFNNSNDYKFLVKLYEYLVNESGVKIVK